MVKSVFLNKRMSNVKSPLHILHLEDNPNDAKLIRAALETEGIACEIICVRTRNDFVAALEDNNIDLVLSDFAMPGFDGVSAREIVRTQWPAMPFIFVSGMLGEKRGMDALKGGAKDYVLKEDLVRLAPAVRRAMDADGEGQGGEDILITKDHQLAMSCLPIDERWQTEAQLIGQTKLGNQACSIYRDLEDAGFCERKIVSILCDITDAEDFMQMYRATRKMRLAYHKRSTEHLK